MTEESVNHSPSVVNDDTSVLIAHSSSFMQSLDATVLARNFTVVDIASTGVEAIDLLEDQSPDVVVASRDLPIRDGLELADAAKTDHDIGVVILCSSGASVSEVQSNERVDEIVTIPYQLEGLVEAVDRAAPDRRP